MKKLNAFMVCEQRNTRLLRDLSARTDAGQALVEAALVLPVLLLMILGALETGSIAYNAIEVANAAEAGALYAAQSRANAANTAGITQAATNDASNVLSVTATATTTCACQSAAGTLTTLACTGTTCLSPSQVVEWVNVVTAAKVTPMFQLPGLPTTLTLNGNATMRVAQN
jgi:Flp pilus assembly protein TadG